MISTLPSTPLTQATQPRDSTDRRTTSSTSAPMNLTSELFIVSILTEALKYVVRGDIALDTVDLGWSVLRWHDEQLL